MELFRHTIALIEMRHVRLNAKLYHKRDDLTFPIVNFPFISSNIPASPASVAYISQLLRFCRAWAQYSDYWTVNTLYCM